MAPDQIIQAATFTPQEAQVIWDALKHSRPYMAHYPEPNERHTEAMKLVSTELRRIGVFPPPPPHPSDR